MGKWNEIGSERERAVERWSYPGRKTKAVGHKPSTYFAQLLKRIECLVRRQPPRNRNRNRNRNENRKENRNRSPRAKKSKVPNAKLALSLSPSHSPFCFR